MPPPEVQFVDKDREGNPCHKYICDGVEIPGLSYILDCCGFLRYGKVNKDIMEAARERGDAAHFATRLYDEDNPVDLVDIAQWEQSALDEPLDSWTRSRLQGWINFRSDFEFKPILIEKPMSHLLNGMLYGFTADRYGIGKLGNMVVEIKCTADIEPSHAIQTAAQAEAFKMEGVQLGRFVCQLDVNDYKPHEFKDRQDARIFAAILAATHWKWKAGIR